jgi:hypothetical protein
MHNPARSPVRLALAALVTLVPLTLAKAGTTYTVTPSSNLQAIDAEAQAGDTMVFTPGTYNVGSTISLQSGVTYQGQPGAVLNSTSSNNTMQGSGVSDVTVSGLTFENGPNLVDGSHGAISLVNGNGVTIANNSFQNINADAAVLFFQGNKINITNNTASNVTEFASGVDSGGSDSGISVSDNTVSGVSRIRAIRF